MDALVPDSEAGSEKREALRRALLLAIDRMASSRDGMDGLLGAERSAYLWACMRFHEVIQRFKGTAHAFDFPIADLLPPTVAARLKRANVTTANGFAHVPYREIETLAEKEGERLSPFFRHLHGYLNGITLVPPLRSSYPELRA
jgi:hypothetical protein